jgi:hypothetical protein
VGAPAGRAVLERDQRVLVHPQRLIDEAIAGAGERQFAVRPRQGAAGGTGWNHGPFDLTEFVWLFSVVRNN